MKQSVMDAGPGATGTPPGVDFAETRRFLGLFDHGPHTYQVIPDNESATSGAWHRTADFEAIHEELEAANRQGCGVHFMVNKGDGRGRRKKNVVAVRAVFVDLDGAPLEPVLNCGLKPHIVVETSPRRFHVYWLVKDFPLSEFGRVQKGLARRFGADPTCTDLPRVLRVPGFLHQKGDPFRVRIVEINDGEPLHT